MDRCRDSLSDAVLVLLEHAGAKRASAERARRLAKNMPTERTTADLHRYAAELELTACEIEERACAVAETAEKSDGLASDIIPLVEEARRRIADTYPYRRPLE